MGWGKKWQPQRENTNFCVSVGCFRATHTFICQTELLFLPIVLLGLVWRVVGGGRKEQGYTTTLHSSQRASVHCTLAWLHPQPLCAKASCAMAWGAVKASSLILISDPHHVFMPEMPSRCPAFHGFIFQHIFSSLCYLEAELAECSSLTGKTLWKAVTAFPSHIPGLVLEALRKL